MLRTDSVPAPADSVTPLADHDDPGPAVASTQVVPPSALTWIFSPAPSVPRERPAHRLRRHIGDEVGSRCARVGAQRRHRRYRARPAGLQRIAVAGARRGIAGGVNTLHQQRAGCPPPASPRSPTTTTQGPPSHPPRWCHHWRSPGSSRPLPAHRVNVPLTVCDATLVMKSPAVPVSALSAVTVATALGGVASTMMVCALVVVVALPARSVTVTLRLL